MDSQANAPVLLVGFRRPETTAKVIEALRVAQVKKLYIAIDAPRLHLPDEVRKVGEVRDVIKSLTSDLEVVWAKREKNLGCFDGVSKSVSWFFEHESEGIILEDDCVPSSTYLRYSTELLERFRRDDRIASIGGSAFIPSPMATSYWFSNYADVWGWATWRRAWNLFDPTMQSWPAWRDAGGLQKMRGSTPGFVRYWTKIFNHTYDTLQTTNSWDYVWMFDCWRHGLLSVMPAKSLIKNIGFGNDATHTFLLDEVNPYVAAEAHDVPFPLRHNEEIAVNLKAERLYTRNRYSVDAMAQIAAYAERLGPIGKYAVRAAQSVRQGKNFETNHR